MDKELIESATEENIEVETTEIVESAVNAEDLEQSTEVEETSESIEVVPVEEIEIEVDESIGWTGGDSTRHYSLSGRDEPNQHPIAAIIGLRDELDEIEALKTVYSDKNGVANYYEWNDGTYDEFGYFVSLVPHTSTITICNGTDIFGVTVDNAGFVGGQNKDIPMNNKYGLVVTSGLVDVRCESDVVEGDYVISNSYGIAQKTDSTYAYKVITKENKNGVDYVSISLGVQACVTDAINKNLQHLDKRMGDAEDDIDSAINTANEAYKKAKESMSSNESMNNLITDALSKVDDMAADVENMDIQVSNIAVASAQAKEIAESAATYAESSAAFAKSAASQAESAATVSAQAKEIAEGAASQADDKTAITFDGSTITSIDVEGLMDIGINPQVPILKEGSNISLKYDENTLKLNTDNKLYVNASALAGEGLTGGGNSNVLEVNLEYIGSDLAGNGILYENHKLNVDASSLVGSGLTVDDDGKISVNNIQSSNYTYQASYGDTLNIRNGYLTSIKARGGVDYGDHKTYPTHIKIQTDIQYREVTWIESVYWKELSLYRNGNNYTGWGIFLSSNLTYQYDTFDIESGNVIFKVATTDTISEDTISSSGTYFATVTLDKVESIRADDILTT